MLPETYRVYTKCLATAARWPSVLFESNQSTDFRKFHSDRARDSQVRTVIPCGPNTKDRTVPRDTRD